MIDFNGIQDKEDLAIQNEFKMNERSNISESITFENSLTTIHLLVSKILVEIKF